jgi:RimJ/RimL family protein N-acetyltransferase
MQFGSKQIALDESRRITFRPVDPDDEAFLISVYGSTRLEELALTGWDESERESFVLMQFEAQQAHYRQNYPDAEHLIILLNGERVGRLYVSEIKSEIRIIDVTILPEYRKGGAGTRIIDQLQDEAAQIGKPLTIYVETFNRSYRLFERLGFVKSGESGYSHLMEWRAKAERDESSHSALH